MKTFIFYSMIFSAILVVLGVLFWGAFFKWFKRKLGLNKEAPLIIVEKISELNFNELENLVRVYEKSTKTYYQFIEGVLVKSPTIMNRASEI